MVSPIHKLLPNRIRDIFTIYLYMCIGCLILYFSSNFNNECNYSNNKNRELLILDLEEII